MKHTSALLTTAALLLCVLTACGGDRTDKKDNSVTDAESSITDDVTGKTSDRPSVTDELKVDPATGTRYTGQKSDRVARYGNGYGNTNADKSVTSGVAPETALPDSYIAPTGQAAASVRGMTDPVRYRQMLENARVHDTDGFLLDGENAHYNTLW